MNKKIVYCTNIHNKRDLDHLLKNIEHINSIFDTPPIFVASNGNINVGVLPLNVYFKQFKANDTYQTGPLNSTINSLKLAAENIPNIEDYNIIFSHPDLYVRDVNRVQELMNMLDKTDVICRNYIGPGGNKIPKIGYFMTEDFLIAGRAVKKFLSLKYDMFDDVSQLTNGVLEITLAALFTNILQLNVSVIDFVYQSELTVNEMGFYHDHQHYKEIIKDIPNLSLLTHSHTDCSDILPLHFNKIQKYYYEYYKLNTPHYLLVNDKIDSPYSTNQIYYNNNETFGNRIIKALTNIKEDYVVFLLEDYILYDYVDFGKMLYYTNILNKDKNIGFIRLIQSGVVSSNTYNDELIVLDKFSPYYFSTQATIWRKSVLLNLFCNYNIDRKSTRLNSSH